MRSILSLVGALTLAAAITATAAAAGNGHGRSSSASSFGHVRPDDRPVGPMSYVPTVANVGHVRPDDRPVGPMPYVPSPTATASHVQVARPGFGWRDAAIGAAAGAGLVLLALGASLLMRHIRAEPRTA